MTRAVGLLSGGLDSVLAARLLQEQGIEVLGVCFVSPFFGADKAVRAARDLGIELKIIDFTDEHLEMVKDPPSGYGKNMNPCIDCHALMIEHAGRLMESEGYDFIFTGEVLGERPMSQNRGSLNRVARLSGYRDYILRPLSALCLDETPVETRGLVDRERLEGISGRSRKPQMALADRFGITSYESPGGGCLLTCPNYSRRLSRLFEALPGCGGRECRLIRLGRIFWVGPSAMAVVGRRHAENLRIEQMAIEGDVLLHVAGDIPGASVLLSGNYTDSEIHRAAALAVRYSDAGKDEPVQVIVRILGGETRRLPVRSAGEAELERWRG